MKDTFVGILPSGLEFETRRLKGDHQDKITQNANTMENLLDVMEEMTVRIGDDRSIDKSKLRGVGSIDFLKALLFTRFFSVDPKFPEKYDEYLAWLESRKNDPENTPENFESSHPTHYFKFNYEYMNERGEKSKKLFEVPLFISDFEEKPYANGPFKSLDDFEDNRKQSVYLEFCETWVYWFFQRVQDENPNAAKRGVNEMIRSRRPVYYKESGGSGEPVPIELNVGRLDIPDVETLRADIYEKEANVDPTIEIPHPVTGEHNQVNVLNVAAFFFPSGVV